MSKSLMHPHALWATYIVTYVLASGAYFFSMNSYLQALPLVKETKIDPKTRRFENPQVPYPAHRALYRPHNCPADINFLGLVQKRHELWLPDKKTLDMKYLQENNVWQLTVDNKWGGYLFAKASGVRIPEIYHCSTEGPKGLDNWKPPNPVKGFVVKDLDGYSSKGVYVLESGFNGTELIRRKNMTWKAIKKSMIRDNQMNVYIEERMEGEVPGQPPFDYKFYMFNGVVGAILIVAHRGTHQFCDVYVDEDFNRLDQFGCFNGRKNESGRNVSPYQICSDFQKPKAWSKLIDTAKMLSRQVGIFMRIDLYVNAEGEVVLGEFSPFPDAGHYHCIATFNPKVGRVDPCLLGRLWNESSSVAESNQEGGPSPPVPTYMMGWEWASDKELCRKVMEVSSANKTLY